MSRWSSAVAACFAVFLVVAMAACGASNDSSGFAPGGADAAVDDGPASTKGGDGSTTTTTGGGDGGSLIGHEAGSFGGDAAAGFDVQPSGLQTLTVTIGQTIPTIAFKALENGQPVTAGWTVDRGDLATITQGTSAVGTFTPTAGGGGLVTVTAGRNNVTVVRQVFVKIVATQNGANAAAPGEGSQIAPTNSDAGVNSAGVPVVLSQGGGIGGVGGEGLGGAVTDKPTLTALSSPTNGGAGNPLTWLYPYDGTVWPRGVLAPLLQWAWATGDADAIEIKLATTSGSFSWTGTFGRPGILSQVPNGKYTRAPIPQDVWAMATNTAGGPLPTAGKVDQLGVSLVIAKNGVGYGPISETWTVAPGLLDGIIYYNSYGTQLAQNSTGAKGGNGSFGGAVLSIQVGATGPKLVAGGNGGATACRVCHSVAAQGGMLVAQHGDNNYDQSSAYTLSPSGSTEYVMSNHAEFPGMYPDGTMALTESALLLPLPNDSATYATSGLTSFSSDVGTPAFSPSGDAVVMNPMKGPTPNTPTQQLWVMKFAKSGTGASTVGAFSNPVLVVDDTGQSSDVRPGWGAFLPDGNSIVFQAQSSAGDGYDPANGALFTRHGNLSQIHWTSAADSTHVTALNELNGIGASGLSYLPKLPAAMTLTCTADSDQVGQIDDDHSDDVDHNYEPTVNPVPAGGYVWVVFTSRRMYGSVADIPPFCSDPRGVDLVDNTTTKKLWVAAIDVNAKPGTDASHPAFYLPGQELLAGNSRAFWVQAPCLADGASCMTGDQCCNGYCEEGTNDAGQAGLVCGNKPPNATCSEQGDKCTSSADCCLTTDTCINGFCEQSTAQ